MREKRLFKVLKLGAVFISLFSVMGMESRAQGLQPSLVAVYEATGPNDQLISLILGEGSPTYRYQNGVAFYVNQNVIAGAASMIPIFRCYSGVDHFVSTRSNCENANFESQYGYVFKDPSPGLLAVQRFYSPSLRRHFITVNPAEIAASDYYVEEILGYAFPPSELQYPVQIPMGNSAWVPVYEATGRDHLLSLNYGEGAPAYTYQGIAFYVLQDPNYANGQPLKALFRCFYDYDHFASTDGNCEGTSRESQFGYIYANPSIGTSPLYRYYSPSNRNHWITANPSEVFGDYTIETILGYVSAGPYTPPQHQVTCSISVNGQTFSAQGTDINSATSSVLQACTSNPRNVCRGSQVVCRQ